MNSSRKRYFWASLAAFHITLLGTGALELRAPKRTKLVDAYMVYGALTGTTDGYRFFAPEILSEIRARFILEDTHGKTYEDLLQSGGSREASLRIGNMTGVIAEYLEDEEMRRKLSASWAGKMFARHPDATKVTVVVEGYELASMDEWQKTKVARWEPFYQVTYKRKQNINAPRQAAEFRGAE